MTTLLMCELRGEQIHPATLNAVTAACALGAELHLLVAATPDKPVVGELANLAGVARVRCLSAAHYHEQSIENLAMAVAQIAGRYQHVIVAATPFGKSLAPRLAAMLDVAPVSDVCEILAPDRFVRPIYAGNVLATVVCREPVVVLTIRPTAFAAARGGLGHSLIDEAPGGPDMGVSRLLSRTLASGDRPALNAARIVVAGGRGLGSKENFERLIHPLAEHLGAAIGATRAAVDAGFAPHDWQIGQTGQIVAPELYLAVGISGAAQHLAGMRTSRVIVAIDRDPEAPIMKIADYSLGGDLNHLLPALLADLRQQQ